MNNLSLKFENIKVRHFIVDGNPLFVSVDVAKAVGYEAPRDVGNRVCSDAKHYTYQQLKDIFISGNQGNTEDYATLEISPNGCSLIPESDVYQMIFLSTKPEAMRFKSWLANDVLPSIRKTGSYSVKPMTQLEIARMSLEKLIEQEKKLIEHEDRLKRVESKQSAFEEGLSYFTVLGYGAYKGITVDLSTAQKIGREASELSKGRGVPIDRTKDARFGMVNSYHEKILDEVIAGML